MAIDSFDSFGDIWPVKSGPRRQLRALEELVVPFARRGRPPSTECSVYRLSCSLGARKKRHTPQVEKRSGRQGGLDEVVGVGC